MASTKFITGPARDIIPSSSYEIWPVRDDIYTAPGARNTNPKNDVITPRRRPKFHFLNSA